MLQFIPGMLAVRRVKFLFHHDSHYPVHPQFHYVSHITAHKSGEQLLSQFIRLMPGKQWLFQYGRITMNFLLSDYLYRVSLQLLSFITYTNPCSE